MEFIRLGGVERMGKISENARKKLADAAIALGEKSCVKSGLVFVHEVAMPEILKKEMKKEQLDK